MKNNQHKTVICVVVHHHIKYILSECDGNKERASPLNVLPERIRITNATQKLGAIPKRIDPSDPLNKPIKISRRLPIRSERKLKFQQNLGRQALIHKTRGYYLFLYPNVKPAPKTAIENAPSRIPDAAATYFSSTPKRSRHISA